MEKRKLAKIPREEASEAMVRFAERAAGTHIVTTRDIEKDLLMVTFYPIGKLKKGEKGAQLRTFFSKNDYISQDLTSERVKWLTAAFDRMECIHLYEYHWDRDKGNRYTPNMFFWTDADIMKTEPLEPYVPFTYYHHGTSLVRQRKFRKYRQDIGGKTVYYKEFGDPRIMDRRNGEYLEAGETLDRKWQANEILEFAIGTKPYGEIRWIGQLLGVDGSRRAESLNNKGRMA